MKTRKIIAAAMAAALTVTAMPSYSLSRAPFALPAYAADAEEDGRIWTGDDGVSYMCYSDHATVYSTYGVEGDIVISTADGLPVTAIDCTAFSFADGMANVTIPATVKSIDPAAFIDCDELEDIWFEGTIEEWNSIPGHPYIPENAALHCKDAESGEYITPVVMNVRFENIAGDCVKGINATIRFNSPDAFIAAEWVSGEYTASVAVPADPGEGQYTISHDAAENYCVYTDSSVGISFCEGQTRYSKTIVVDHNNVVTMDELFEDGNCITEGENMVLCIAGENITLGGTDNGVMSYELLRKDDSQAFYRLKANKPGRFELIVNSDDREEAENIIFEVLPRSEEPTATRCGGARLVEAPDTELTVGQTTSMEVWGYGYVPIVYVKNDPQSDDWTKDSTGEYVALEKWTVNGEYTTYRLIAKQPCAATVSFYLSNLGASINPDFEITVKEEEEEPNDEDIVDIPGAIVFEEPNTELVIGEKTVMTVRSGRYKPYVKVYNKETGEWEIDENGDYAHIEAVSSDDLYTTYELEAVQTCRAEVVFYIDMSDNYDDTGIVLDITGEPLAYTVGDIVEAPQTELAVGQSTTMTVYGSGIAPTVKVYGRADDYTFDISGDFIEVEEISRNGELVTYRVTPKKKCRASVYFSQSGKGSAADFTIYEGAPIAGSNEPAETAAAEDKKGDANTDGKVNVADSVKVLQFISNQEKYPMTEKQRILSDIDGIEGISGGDAITIQKIDAGII
ncbi:MAG: hypothetical protein J5501_01935 [Ruminococcus sp.]|nr:hypothetical protein [Ruminococcus sp.]